MLDANGEPVVCEIDIGMNKVLFKAWQVNVGRVKAYLLDTNLPENEQLFRDLTLRVYGGDSTTRIMQEMVLGIGGVKWLRKLGIQPSVFHMNEGHAAFLALELMREKITKGKSLADALKATRTECHFTTHTPVEAGHDRFSPSLIQYALTPAIKALNAPLKEFMGLGRVNPTNEDDPFCMTVLALKASRSANGVSELHGQVSRQMWHVLYPDRKIADVPIGHITNGIHLMGWMKGPVRRFWRKKLADEIAASEGTTHFGEGHAFWLKKGHESWEQIVNCNEFWERMADPAFISDEEIWALRYKLRRELIAAAQAPASA